MGCCCCDVVIQCCCGLRPDKKSRLCDVGWACSVKGMDTGSGKRSSALEQPVIPELATPSFVSGEAPKDVLRGPLGLRAGWGLLVFFVLALLCGFVLFVGLFRASGHGKQYRREMQEASAATARAKAAHQPPPVQSVRLPVTLLAETAQAEAVLLAAWGVCFFEKRRFGVYGLGTRHLRDVVPGAGVGLAAIGVLVRLLRMLHLLVFDQRLLSGMAAVRYGLAWLLAFLLVGLSEEFVFRGYIQFTLMRGLLGLAARISPAHVRAAAFWMAALVWSLLFSAAHLTNAGEDPVGLVMVFAAGIVFAYALWRTGSLWWGIGFHMAWDWGQSFLFGVPDSGTLSVGRLFATHAQGRTVLSGGTTGPEGSVYAVLVLLLVAGVIRLHPQREQPPVEPESLPVVPHPVPASVIP